MSRTGLLGITLLAVALLPSVAWGGTYDVYACRLPDGRAVPSAGWTSGGLVSGQYVYASEGCPGGALLAGVDARVEHPRGTTIGWRFDAPADTTLAGYELTRRVLVTAGAGSAWNYEAFLDRVDYAQAGRHDHCWASDGCGGIAAAQPLVGSGLAARSLILFTDCSSGLPNPCQAGTRAEIEVAAARMRLEDAFDPVFTAPPSGTLLSDAAPLTGVQGLSFAAADRGGGLYRAILEVDGSPVVDQPVDANGGACVAPFTRPVPCKLQASGSLAWDTASVPDGHHALRLLVRDASGTNQAVYGPVDVVTANAAGHCAPDGAGGTLSARFAGDRGRSTTLRYGRGRTIRGWLADPSGAPIAGASVRWLSQVRREGAPVKVGRTPLVSRADGTFAYRIPAGPSRILRFGWRPSAGAPLACSAPLSVNVRAPVRLRAAPRHVRPGHRVRLSGRLRGGYVPRGGKVVDVQAHERGCWRTFDTVRTGRRGRFSLRYRFSGRARGTFPIRARVRPDLSYPFTLGYSRAVRVRVG